MERQYCPLCFDALDSDNRCWGTRGGYCDMAGTPQPPIHIGVFTEDSYEIRDGCGRLIRTYTMLRFVRPSPTRASGPVS